MKDCKNCKHRKWSTIWDSECRRPNHYFNNAENERQWGKYCGPTAKYFEPRLPRFQWLRKLFENKPEVLQTPEFDFTQYKPESWK